MFGRVVVFCVWFCRMELCMAVSIQKEQQVVKFVPRTELVFGGRTKIYLWNILQSKIAIIPNPTFKEEETMTFTRIVSVGLKIVLDQMQNPR